MSGQSPKLSIIVPMYNAGRYVADALRSVTDCNGFTDYEIVVVNDGSTDDSPRIVQELADKYCCIRLIDQPNGGVSAARNRGLDEARGEYVYFMDADDRLVPGALDLVMGVIERHRLGMLCFKTMGIYDYAQISDYDKPAPTIDNIEIKTVPTDRFIKDSQVLAWNRSTMVSYIFRRLDIEQSGQRFDTELLYCEDLEYLLRLLPLYPEVSIIDNVLYLYIHRPESATGARNRRQRLRMNDSLLPMAIAAERIARSAWYAERPELQACLRQMIATRVYAHVGVMAKLGYPSDQIAGNLRTLADEGLYPYGDFPTLGAYNYGNSRVQRLLWNMLRHPMVVKSSAAVTRLFTKKK